MCHKGEVTPRTTPGVTALTSLSRQNHSLPELPYRYNALEPVISGEIMELHHKKHHATYVNNLNAAEEQLKQCVDEGISYINIICLFTEVMFINKHSGYHTGRKRIHTSI